MARHYTRKDFIRHAPAEPLHRYLSQPEFGSDVPWEKLDGKDPDLVFRRIDEATASVQESIDRDFRDVHALVDVQQALQDWCWELGVLEKTPGGKRRP